MSKSDYLRPSANQINTIYRCAYCGSEHEIEGWNGTVPVCCGTSMQVSGESYPATSDDWEEERDTQDGEWRQRR